MILIFCELVTLKKDEFHLCFCKPKQAEKNDKSLTKDKLNYSIFKSSINMIRIFLPRKAQKHHFHFLQI